MYAPFILIFHWLNFGFYFWRMENDPGEIYWHQYGWAVYYDSIQFLTLLSYLVVFVRLGFPTNTEKHFILIDIIFTFSLFICRMLEYKGYLQSTHGLLISICCMIVATVVVAISAYRHGYFKNY